ncbi:hypothetical protein HY634_03820 [Candidatus Uhrbacteria bacterium]|nr:hypothetical protein [Candidatus Uhrbacteria bacterium]
MAPDIGSPRHPLVTIQAKRLWDKGWGAAIGIAEFQQYIATIPEIPADLIPEHVDFPDLVLEDLRPFAIPSRPFDLVKACRILGVLYEGDDRSFEDPDPSRALRDPVRWVRMHDGRRNRNRKAVDCRATFDAHGVGASVCDGLFLYAQRPSVLYEPELHFIDLPNAIRVGQCGLCAYLRRWPDGVVGLCWGWGGAVPHCGAASPVAPYAVAMRREALFG